MRLSHKFSRLLLAGIATITLVAGTTVGAAQADDFYKTRGDFSWRSTEVKRLANCAASAWFNGVGVGSEIKECANADTNPYWDGVHLLAADYLELIGERVGYLPNQGCPPKHGFAYIKCFYVAGKQRGNPVITISAVSYGFGGMTARVSWYYL